MRERQPRPHDHPDQRDLIPGEEEFSERALLHRRFAFPRHRHIVELLRDREVKRDEKHVLDHGDDLHVCERGGAEKQIADKTPERPCVPEHAGCHQRPPLPGIGVLLRRRHHDEVREERDHERDHRHPEDRGTDMKAPERDHRENRKDHADIKRDDLFRPFLGDDAFFMKNVAERNRNDRIDEEERDTEKRVIHERVLPDNN